ncbi:MAG TPA: hypothetical protein VF049_08285 [Nocardioidaceae bacterium]|jgi:hypothetical protein
MIKSNKTFGQWPGFGMPMSGSAPVAIVRALPTTGVVSAVIAGPKCDRVDATNVAAYSVITTDVAVLEGAFPGTSAWSPPI